LRLLPAESGDGTKQAHSERKLAQLLQASALHQHYQPTLTLRHNASIAPGASQAAAFVGGPLDELDEGALTLEQVGVVAGAGVNLLRLNCAAIAHPIETPAIDLCG
jgi:hypothetical protein